MSVFRETNETDKFPYKYLVKKLETKPTKKGGEYSRFKSSVAEKYTDANGQEQKKYHEADFWIFGKCNDLTDGCYISFDQMIEFYAEAYISKSGATAGKAIPVQVIKLSSDHVTVYQGRTDTKAPVKPVEVVELPYIEPIDTDSLPF